MRAKIRDFDYPPKGLGSISRLVDWRLFITGIDPSYGNQGVQVKLIHEGVEQNGAIDEHLRKRLLARMGEESVFMQELKQCFSKWYDQQSNRFGAKRKSGTRPLRGLPFPLVLHTPAEELRRSHRSNCWSLSR